MAVMRGVALTVPAAAPAAFASAVCWLATKAATAHQAKCSSATPRFGEIPFLLSSCIKWRLAKLSTLWNLNTMHKAGSCCCWPRCKVQAASCTHNHIIYPAEQERTISCSGLTQGREQSTETGIASCSYALRTLT